MSDAATYVINPEDDLVARVVGAWAERKYHFLGRYQRIFATGMAKKWPERVYLDLMSGPGIVTEDGTNFILGSPLLALQQSFTRFVFVDMDQSVVDALWARAGPLAAGRPVEVIRGDCNAVIDDVIRKIPPSSALTFAFIDPTNWQVKFDTIAKLGSTRRVDLLVTFHVGAMKRVAHIANQPKVDAFFGTDAWRRPGSKVTMASLMSCYRDRLSTLGYLARPPERDIVVRNSRNSPMYLMAFFSKNERGLVFWDKVTGIDEEGQLALPLTPACP